MKKLITKSFLALLGLIMFANVNLAMGQNMSRWIELTVTPGQQIQLDFAADTANTQVKVVSGTKDTTLTVGTSWTDLINYYAQAGTMRLYGNINKLDCGGNNSKITGLDVSNNSGLIELRCSANELSSLNLTNLTALLEFYCQNNKLSSLDLTNLTALAYLECFNNNLSSIKISGCESLCYISCRGNNLSACGLDSLFHQLSRRAEDNKGKIYIQNGIYGTNPAH